MLSCRRAANQRKIFQLAVDEFLPCVVSVCGSTRAEGLRHKLEMLLGECLFKEEHRKDMALAYQTTATRGNGAEDVHDQGKQEGQKCTKGKARGKGIHEGDKKLASYQRCLFDKLRSIAGEGNGGLQWLPNLVGMFLVSSRGDASVPKGSGKVVISSEMAFVRELYSIAASVRENDDEHYLTAVVGLMQAVVSWDIYRAQLFTNDDCEKKFLAELATELTLLACRKGGEAALDAACLLVKIDHTVVEPHAQDLVSLSFQQFAAGATDGSGALFVSGMCAVYGKLSQTDRLMGWMLQAVRTSPSPQVSCRF